ncbi:hypothetical protein KSP40_PGU017687 [Platanthera guangdongensis]|uniref:Uncharacterized protein n=1 Tax=Platanthera guangdongensis TaxID=2320717 RepID=A0ABR2M1Z9_9ASPA
MKGGGRVENLPYPEAKEEGEETSAMGIGSFHIALPGVRGEVGYHAKVINELLKARDLETKSEASLKPGKVVSVLSGTDKGNAFVGKKTEMHSLVNAKEESEKFPLGEIHLNESVGHTEIQVLAGAFLGFIVSLMVNAAIT